MQVPDAFLRAAAAGVELPPPGRYGVGVCYLPTDAERRVVIEQLIEETIEAEGQRPIWWRDVPVDDRHVGETARVCAPVIRQVLIEAAEEHRGPGRVRAQAVRDPPRDRARRRPRGRAPQLLEPHDRLQGDADRAAAAALLHRPSRPAPGVPPGARALALLDQHVPELGARAPVPDDRPQRRGQHAARQRQLDARPRVAARLRAVRRRPAEGDPGRARGRLGLGDLRQRARAARAERAPDPARGDDDGPRGLPDAQGPRPRRQGLLRLPLVPDGAVGRAGRGGVHRRTAGRRGARPKRPASRALDPGHRGLRRARVRGGRDDGRARARAAQGPAGPRQAVPRRPRGGPDRRRRGGQAPGGAPQAVRRVVRALGRPHRRPTRPRAACAPDRAASLKAAGVRLLAGGPADGDRADGGQGRGAGREHGQRRRAGGAV